MYAEEDLLPLSGIQHLLFCERQCALIHIERQWHENRLTAEGRILHRKVDGALCEMHDGIRIEYSVPLRSLRLGLYGKADVVEFHQTRRNGSPGTEPYWVPYPVEYKRGRKKKGNFDRIQLCAQGMCLEEMLAVSVSEGSIFYGRARRRELVKFDNDLRQETEEAARSFHALVEKGVTPKAVFKKSCHNCSLQDICMPGIRRKETSVRQYLTRALGRL